MWLPPPAPVGGTYIYPLLCGRDVAPTPAGVTFLPYSAGEMWLALLHEVNSPLLCRRVWLLTLHEVFFSLTQQERCGLWLPNSAGGTFFLTLQVGRSFLTLQ